MQVYDMIYGLAFFSKVSKGCKIKIFRSVPTPNKNLIKTLQAKHLYPLSKAPKIVCWKKGCKQILPMLILPSL